MGATPPRTATPVPRTATSPPANGGNCTIRGATRRRHAEGRLLMLQNPHRQRCDALRKGQRARAGPGAACFPMTPPPNGGNCSNRGATRRRHAGRRLLMVQNPHRQPDIHPGAKGGGPEATGALRDTSLATAPAGGDPTTSRQISHVISPRSLFKTTRKRCNSNDADSTFELIAGELRATLIVEGSGFFGPFVLRGLF